MIDSNDREIKTALHAARQAGIIVDQIQTELVSPAMIKSDRSPVTVADFASQAIVSWHLLQAFPEVPLVAEEDARALRAEDSKEILDRVTSFVKRIIPSATAQSVCDLIDRGCQSTGDRFWTLDPIDGTKGFLRGDQYAIALALIVDGVVQLGVLGCPNLAEGSRLEPGGPGSLVIASRQMGTWTAAMHDTNNFNRLNVSNCEENASARILRSFESGHTHVDDIETFRLKIGTYKEPTLMDSQAKYAVLAGGGGEILLRLLSSDQPNYREKIWDHAAGSLILEEAGGRITDLDVKNLDFTCGRSLINNRGVLATNSRMHSAALDVLRSLGI